MSDPKPDTIIGASVQISGDLFFSGCVQLDGVILGNVSAEPADASIARLGDHARVEGDVTAMQLIVGGLVEGNVKCSSILLLPTAQVCGDLEYQELEVRPGAKISGTVSCSLSPVWPASHKRMGKPSPIAF